MLEIYDELLTDEQKQKLEAEYGEMQFATVAYTEDQKLPLIFSMEDGVSPGQLNIEIVEQFEWHDPDP